MNSKKIVYLAYYLNIEYGPQVLGVADSHDRSKAIVHEYISKYRGARFDNYLWDKSNKTYVNQEESRAEFQVAKYELNKSF
jgi:hypothetical protein